MLEPDGDLSLYLFELPYHILKGLYVLPKCFELLIGL